MAFQIKTQPVQATAPIEFALRDRSGAHVILTVIFNGQEHAPITHAFVDKTGLMSVEVNDLAPGIHQCTFVVQAIRSPLNGMFDSALEINGQSVASAKGNIPKGKPSEIGSGDFDLTV